MRLTEATLDTYTTVHTLFGNQLVGRKGYNPKSKGKKSYQSSQRVPEIVHKHSSKLIREVSRRQEKPYRPRSAKGLLVRLPHGGYKSPEHLVLKSVMQHLERGHTVMLLTSCGYMLHPLIATLRKSGIPFHNPYRRSHGLWNPLRIGSKGSSASRILSLLAAHPDYGDDARPWTYRDLNLWCAWLKSEGILKHGAAERIEKSRGDVTIEALGDLFETAALDSLLATFRGDHRQLLHWWRRRLAAQYHTRTEFANAVIVGSGPEGLKAKPKVVVGTIHSVKGGEADAVFLFPDLSRAGDAAYQRRGPLRDSIIRLFYVGMTRAREALYICQRESSMAIVI